MPREIILRTWPFLDSIMSRAPTAVKRRRFTQRIIRRLVKQWVSVCPNKYNRWPWVMPFVLAANAPHFHPAKLYIESPGYRFNWLTIDHDRGNNRGNNRFYFHPSIRKCDPFVFRLRYLDLVRSSSRCFHRVEKFMDRSDHEFSYFFSFLLLDPDSSVFTKRRVRVAEHLVQGR